MASFRFRLAAVLRWRERLKEAKEFELKALYLEHARRGLAICALQAELERIEANLGAQAGQIFSPLELQLSDEQAQLLAHRIELEQRDLASLQERLEHKRQELAEALRQVKSLEALRQRLEEKFHRQLSLEEQKFLDELGQRRFGRR